MMRARSPVAALVVSLMLASPAAFPDEAERPVTNRITRPVPITSHQRNFIVSGMTSRDALEVAIWAEKVKSEIEDIMGVRVPSRQMYPVIISAEQREEAGRGWVQAIQHVTDDGNVRQELIMVNPAIIDQEDALELLTRLLLDRWIIARIKRDGDLMLPETPGWLAVGMAQHVYPELRARNRREIRMLMQSGKQVPDTADLLNWWRFPAGRWPEKYLAGLLFEWTKERVAPKQLVEAMADALAAGAVWDAASIASLCGYPSVRDLTMAFDVELARQKNRIVPGQFEGDFSEIERVLALSSRDFGLIWPDGTEPALTPALLAARRREAWVRELAATARVRLGLALASQPVELADALAGYLAFFSELAAASPEMPDDELLARWREAGEAFDGYRRHHQVMARMMDDVDLPSVTVEPENRAALEEMLDRIEADRPSP